MNEERTQVGDPVPFDEEEKELMASVERDEWRPVDDFAERKVVYQKAARDTLRKNRRINLRLSEKDFHDIQIKALEEGIPYQTLIASLVHQYLNGTLVHK
jgi:predicted DNA binding CopG/RHH family protein